MSQKQILLMNIGTPQQADAFSVYRYLKEFLSDARVVDLPWIVRWPLVNLLILPFRYKKSTAAYQQIWQDSGSPLLIHSQGLQQALSSVLGPEYQVEIAMRYGQPSIEEALKKFKTLTSLTVLPLFPQYSSAATGSAIAALLNILSKQTHLPDLHIYHQFYNHPGFIAAYADIIKQHCADTKPDLILFSYHGLPERHIHTNHCETHCDQQQTCPARTSHPIDCYRAACYATSQLIATSLQLTPHQYRVSFQSRLGRTPWIKPYTDLVLPELIQQGVKHLAIVCPSFVADCLETLEEINIRAREQWSALGGTQFTFIPCLNDSPLWVNAVADMVLKK